MLLFTYWGFLYVKDMLSFTGSIISVETCLPCWFLIMIVIKLRSWICKRQKWFWHHLRAKSKIGEKGFCGMHFEDFVRCSLFQPYYPFHSNVFKHPPILENGKAFQLMKWSKTGYAMFYKMHFNILLSVDCKRAGYLRKNRWLGPMRLFYVYLQ